MRRHWKLPKRYSEMFRDNFFIELQRNGMKEQEIVNEGLLKIAKEVRFTNCCYM